MTSPDRDRRTTMPSRCTCGHNQARHEVAGFDGDCIAQGCSCHQFRPVASAGGEQPRDAMPALHTTDQVIAAARRSGQRRMLLTVAQIDHCLNELRALFAADQAAKRATAVKALVVEEKRTGHRPSSGDIPCRRGNCDRTFNSGQARAMHERRTHDGFDPNAKKNTPPTERTAP